VALAVAWHDRLDADKAQWARAADVQAAVLAGMHRAIPRPAYGTTVYAFGFPTTSGPGVPVFLWITDLSGAMRVTYGDRSLTGYPMPAGTALVCGANEMHPLNNGYSEAHRTPYGATVLFDATTGRSVSVRDRRGCEREAPTYVPGPGRFASG
jgi:hypothetical protein